MRASEKTYRKVAECCSHYEPKDGENGEACGCGQTNAQNCACGCDEASCSCTNCCHFKQEHCDIDLYDKIVEAHDLKD